MTCPTCGTADARTQILPGYWRCEAVVRAADLVPAGPAAAAEDVAEPDRCGAVYFQAPDTATDPTLCRCGDPSVGECAECTRPVCADHSDLWLGWRVCDRDLANARLRAKAAAAEEERRRAAEAAAAEAERERQRSTLLELTAEEALWLLLPQGGPRSDQQLRSAVAVLRRLTAEEFTATCLDVHPRAAEAETRRNGLTRLSGWAFDGPDYHGRSWFLTRKGDWYRSGAYGSTATDGKRCRSVRFDDVEKRAVIDEMAWQQRIDSGLS
jgi:predicted nucleic acid-binding protein